MAGFQIITPTKLAETAIGLVLATAYTGPANTVTYLKDIDIANNTTAAINVTVYIGTGTGTAQVLIPNVAIPANSIFQWTGTQILNAFDIISAIASNIGCAMHISGAQAV